MMYFNWWFSGAILWLVLSGHHYLSEHLSNSLQQSLYQERGQDFPGMHTIFKTYPNFLLSLAVTYVSPLNWLIKLIFWFIQVEVLACYYYA